MTTFVTITHDDVVAAVRTLGDAVLADAWRPDAIVGVGRGGLVPAVYLSHATGLPMQSIDYSGADLGTAGSLIAAFAKRASQGQRLLFVDDINDSGRTIARLRELLRGAGAPDGTIRFATIIDNIGSAARVDYAARAIDRAATKDWFVFPWEAMAPSAAHAEDAAERPERIA